MLIIKYNPILFTADFGPALSAILLDTEKKSNVAFKDMCMIQDIAFSVTHPVTGKEMEWKELVSDPLTSINWIHSTSNKLNRMAQGVGEKTDGKQQTRGTYIIFFIPSYKNPKGQKVTYIQKVCTYCPDKSESNQTRFTAMGNFITDYTSKISTKTARLELIKMHWNSVLSTKKAKYMTIKQLDRRQIHRHHLRLELLKIRNEIINARLCKGRTKSIQLFTIFK